MTLNKVGVYLFTSGLYYKNILAIVSDNCKLRLYYKCFISLSQGILKGEVSLYS